MANKTKSPWVKRRPRRDTKFDEKREAVLTTAASLFLGQGYEKTSLVELANELNVTKPTLYYYVKSKDEILLEIKRRAQDEIIEIIEGIEDSDGSGLEKLEKFIRAHMRVLSSDFGRCLVTVRRASLEPGSRAIMEKRLLDADRRVLAFFQEGIEDGSIRQMPNVKQAYYHMIGSVNWFAVWYRPEGPMTLDQIIDEHVRLLFEGIKSK